MMLRSNLLERRLFFFTYGHYFWTARSKFTPLGKMEETRNNTGNLLETAFGAHGIFIDAWE